MKNLLIFSMLIVFGLTACQPANAAPGSPVSVDGGIKTW